jgi:membrane-bound serine protease (ClpP class)
MKWWLFLLATSWVVCPLPGMAAVNRVALIEVKGPIGPATANYISRATKVAAAEKAEALVLQLDTPGGLLTSTKEIVQAFYSSPVPVVVYVAPSGANAGSAGTFITMAAHVAAMAPNSTIGAAHPVNIGGAPGGGGKEDDVMKEKMTSMAASDIEAIAVKRGRNVEWAKAAVRESASITAEQAVKTNVIDLIAADLPELLNKIDGREVDGRKLRTAGAQVVPVKMTMREHVFQLLWQPEVMFILMLVAMYGIIGELSNPGAILPGVAGAIALVLLLYMSSILPMNLAGIALILLALALFVVDIFAPTHGILTAGGIVAFFLGALMLFDKTPFRLSLGLIVPATVVTALFFIFVVGAGLRAQRLPVKVGAEAMIGRATLAVSPINAQGGRVFIEGEYWTAVSDLPIEAGQCVEVVSIEGLTLKVKPKSS